MAVRKLKGKPPRFIRSAGGNGASAATLRAQADTPVKLLEDLVSKRLDAKDLSKAQRKAVLVLQANGKHTSAELASLLQVSPSLIRKDLQEIRREVGREVQEWSLEDVVGGMVLASEKYQAKAVAQEDYALAWTIERDKVKLLKELGLVGGREEHGVKLTLEVMGAGYDRARAAFARLDPALTGQVVDVEVSRGPRDQLALELPRLVPGSEALPGIPEVEVEDPGEEPVPAVDQDLEDALEQDLRAALEGPGARVGALAGQELELARRAAGHPQA